MTVEIIKLTEIGRTIKRSAKVLHPGDVVDSVRDLVDEWVLQNLISRGVAKLVDLRPTGRPPGLLTNDAPLEGVRNTASPQKRTRRKPVAKADVAPEPIPASEEVED